MKLSDEGYGMFMELADVGSFLASLESMPLFMHWDWDSPGQSLFGGPENISVNQMPNLSTLFQALSSLKTPTILETLATQAPSDLSLPSPTHSPAASPPIVQQESSSTTQ